MILSDKDDFQSLEQPMGFLLHSRWVVCCWRDGMAYQVENKNNGRYAEYSGVNKKRYKAWSINNITGETTNKLGG